MPGILERLFGPRGARFAHASATGRGLVRPDNQDSHFADSSRAVYCVADGMGGGEGGAKASAIACREVSKAAGRCGGFAESVAAVGGAVESANAAIREYARKAGYGQMATTVAVLAVHAPAAEEGDCATCTVGHVGDSRVYRLRRGRLEQLTHDHTLAAELARGKPRTPFGGADMRTGPLSHVLTRAVGIDETVDVEWSSVDVHCGDRFLLCSDGVYDMLPPSKIAELLSPRRTPRKAVDALEKAVLAAGAVDNYTILVVDAKKLR